MSSYYKKIDGKSYDKAMLDMASRSVEGKGDGRISLADARNMIKLIKDGGKITDIEKRTLNYILENYKFTETALKHVEKSLSDTMPSDHNKAAKTGTKQVIREDATQIIKPSEPDKSKKTVFLVLLSLLLAILAVFIYVKKFYKNVKNENVITEKKNEKPVEANIETSAAKTSVNDTAKKDAAVIPADFEQKKPVKDKPLSDNEYMVKDKDTLIKISEAIYGDYRKWEVIYKLNKGKISNPTVLYPGQVLILPEKKGK